MVLSKYMCGIRVLKLHVFSRPETGTSVLVKFEAAKLNLNIQTGDVVESAAGL